MKVEKIKKELLSEHTSLRSQLKLVSELAEKVSAGDSSWEPALRQAAHQFSDTLVQHMENEEKYLASLSRGGNAQWAQHLNDFKHHHGHQRALLSHFIERVDNVHASRRLGEIIQAMSTAVLLDMEHEELSLFSPMALGLTTVQGA